MSPKDDTFQPTTPKILDTFEDGKDDKALPLFDDPDVVGRDEEADDGVMDDLPKNDVPDPEVDQVLAPVGAGSI
jgi:hypothetical protein